jgi:hypothetical protein
MGGARSEAHPREHHCRARRYEVAPFTLSARPILQILLIQVGVILVFVAEVVVCPLDGNAFEPARTLR